MHPRKPHSGLKDAVNHSSLGTVSEFLNSPCGLEDCPVFFASRLQTVVSSRGLYLDAIFSTHDRPEKIQLGPLSKCHFGPSSSIPQHFRPKPSSWLHRNAFGAVPPDDLRIYWHFRNVPVECRISRCRLVVSFKSYTLMLLEGIVNGYQHLRIETRKWCYSAYKASAGICGVCHIAQLDAEPMHLLASVEGSPTCHFARLQTSSSAIQSLTYNYRLRHSPRPRDELVR